MYKYVKPNSWAKEFALTGQFLDVTVSEMVKILASKIWHILGPRDI